MQTSSGSRDLSEADRNRLKNDVVFFTSGHGLLTDEELKEFRHLRGQVGFVGMAGCALLPAHFIVFMNARKDRAKMRNMYFFSTLLFAGVGLLMINYGSKQKKFLDRMAEKYLVGFSDQDIRNMRLNTKHPASAEQKATVAQQIRARLNIGMINSDI